MKDSLDRKIHDRLAGEIDPDELELCVCDLLRPEFPGIAPIPGGQDAGRDGAVPDGEGEPFPLVCTTGKEVSRNLRESLRSYLRAGGTRRKVVLATTQSLTQQRRRRFEDLAREEGFELAQVFEREWVARRLRENPYWCKRLLGLSGAASTLSHIPGSSRPRVQIPLIGRESDLEWLRTTPGDLVLVGEPGSGKTYLLASFAESGGGLFLVVGDLRDFDDDYREQRPARVIVDDAHVDPECLVRLRQRREAIRADFSIVAVTWPGEKDRVIAALGGSPPATVRKLDGLARSEILEIYRTLGVQAPDEVLRELVTQAANKPGLAVTLGTLWRAGEWQKVWEGEALGQATIDAFEKLIGPAAIPILAAFSLGGDAGMPLEEVGKFLQMPVHDIWRKATSLAAGGVLAAEREGKLAVIPPALRSPLLRRVFFQAGAPDFRTLLEAAPDFDRAVHEIVIATHKGGLPFSEVQALVQRTGSRTVWSDFAYRDEAAARWVLGNYPGDVLDIAPAVLDQVPREAIPRLLQRSARDEPRVPFGDDRALVVLGKWLQDIRMRQGSPDEPIRRRRLLAKAARDLLLRGGRRETGVQAIFLSLSPTLAGSSQDPGAGTTITLSRGLLPLAGLREIPAIWREARDAVRTIDAVAWRHLWRALWDWVHPTSAAMSTEVPKETVQAMHSVAAEILRDLGRLAGDSPGAKAGLLRLAEPLGIELGIEPDPVFELLYPAESPLLDAEPVRRQRGEALHALAERLRQEDPRTVARNLAFYEAEARKVNVPKPGPTGELGEGLAAQVEDPADWLTAFLDEDAGSDFVRPLMERVVREQAPGWERLLERCFQVPSYDWDATSVVLQSSAPPAPLLALALERSARHPELVYGLALRREVPTPTLTRLLDHPGSEVSLAAAIGEWGPGSRKHVRPEVAAAWREAILRGRSEEYEDAPKGAGLQFGLGVLLHSDPELALEWLRRKLAEEPPSYIAKRSAFAHAIQGLRPEQRLAILASLGPQQVPPSFMALLIQNDPGLYEELLGRDDLREHHLEPLAGMPDEVWTEKAVRALERGDDPRRVAGAAYGSSHSYVGPGVEYWRRWDAAFAALENHSRSDVRDLARCGREIAGEHLRHAEAEQRRFELHGVG